MSKSKASGSKGNRKHIIVSYEEGNKSEVKDKKTKVEPKNWLQIYENINDMRKLKPAPVDKMGCEQCADNKMDIDTQRFQTLVALMLSAQTRDEVTFSACQRLKEFGFTVEHLAEADQNKLEEVIKPVGFYRQKSKHIIQSSKILRDQYDSKVPNDLKELLKLPGVGKKMANIALASCFDNVVGIGVDTHVHRISNRFGWVNSKTPEETQKQLESWLPYEYWRDINLTLVAFGQTICLPRHPKCIECLNNNICPSAFKESPKKTKSPKKM
ncbi:hypothetical protein PVAND_010947 [Polypedilum vanderplanki]|uniref:Endonuclease III homolog n=1 Tax=Polypedilum vanderplanki TaxID=319348 RepID=A0A9J6CH46_POLVA|nr:hypothetical protein PVAND_010947 [Polypedilum vanderplanki]